MTDVYRRLGEQWWRAQESRPLGENMALAFAAFAKGDAIDFSVRAQSQDAYEIDVTGRKYAQFYKEPGEPELGKRSSPIAPAPATTPRYEAVRPDCIERAA